jgi:hypothetical protein
MKNPFTPGNGIEPGYLAGRSGQLKEFSGSLDNYAEGLPRNLVLFGLRGTGKTVLINHFKAIAENKKWVTIEREFDEKFCQEEYFARALAKDITSRATEVNLSKKIKETGKKILGSVEELSGFGVTYRPYHGTGKEELLSDYLTELLVGNWKVFEKSGKTGVVFLYDEFHTVKDNDKNYPLASLLAALAKAQKKGQKYYVCLIGLPNIKKNLKEAKTYSERMFSFLEVGNLTPEEARAAIKIPLKKSGCSFERKLVDQIAEETRGYPYFIQFYGHFLIDETGKKSIKLKDLQKLRPKLLQQLDVGFFEGRFNDASGFEKEILIAMAKTRETEVSIKKLTKELGIENVKTPRYQHLMNTLPSLVDKKLVYRVRKGSYAFTLPLFADYLLRTPS